MCDFQTNASKVQNQLRVSRQKPKGNNPKELVEHPNLKKGDTVSMGADNSHVVLEKEKKVTAPQLFSE